MHSSTIKVLLDSTYILPSFGVEVEGLYSEHFIKLREAAVKGLVKFYCLPVIWVEVIGKVCREIERSKKDVDDIVDLAVKSFMSSEFYEWLTPTSDAVKLAFKLRKLGQKDVIDNLLYATSAVNNMHFLTMDENLKSFLSKNNFKVDHLINHVKLLKMLS